MEPSEILKTFNSCYVQLQTMAAPTSKTNAQDVQWLALANRGDVDLEMKTHLGDVLHYLGEAMDCIEPFVETTAESEVQI
ncbi:hypothetical protein [Nostoc sp. FACHB-190]|uniref:hypothetical protein n=1 Tax=Nostoc sp. FACHB-190 TaxID=2692838 RepID=UPI00168309C6|nr:hypothetical protein [Nostoc sp. FACHB-190]MBD2302745.1 hypothetical protein [Nostoc sp. FACHB-190]